MAYLLDTNVILRALTCPERLGDKTRDIIIREPCFVSVISIWEIIIKVRSGKLRIPSPAKEVVSLLNAQEMPLTSAHVDQINHISLPHRDPFDYALVAQATVEGLTLITSDKVLLDSSYDVIGSHI